MPPYLNPLNNAWTTTVFASPFFFLHMMLDILGGHLVQGFPVVVEHKLRQEIGVCIRHHLRAFQRGYRFVHVLRSVSVSPKGTVLGVDDERSGNLGSGIVRLGRVNVGPNGCCRLIRKTEDLGKGFLCASVGPIEMTARELCAHRHHPRNCP